MGIYEETLKKVVEEPGFRRLFLGTCKDCGKKIWSVDEFIDPDKGVIKARFLCNCGTKFQQTVYDREKKGGYRYQQGLVSDMVINGKSRRVIRGNGATYIVTNKGIKCKKDRKE